VIVICTDKKLGIRPIQNKLNRSRNQHRRQKKQWIFCHRQIRNNSDTTHMPLINDPNAVINPSPPKIYMGFVEMNREILW